jgi:hypothetical protein
MAAFSPRASFHLWNPRTPRPRHLTSPRFGPAPRPSRIVRILHRQVCISSMLQAIFLSDAARVEPPTSGLSRTRNRDETTPPPDSLHDQECVPSNPALRIRAAWLRICTNLLPNPAVGSGLLPSPAVGSNHATALSPLALIVTNLAMKSNHDRSSSHFMKGLSLSPQARGLVRSRLFVGIRHSSWH